MSIRLGAGPQAAFMHRLGDRLHEDRRLAYTRCGVLFVWGHVSRGKPPLPKCTECWS